MAVPSIPIHGQQFRAVPNPSLFNKEGAPETSWGRLAKFTGTASGSFRLLQLLDRVCRVVALALKDLDSTMAPFFKKSADKLGQAWGMLTIPRLPEVTKAAKKAVDEWINPPTIAPLDSHRDNVQKVHDVFDAAAAWLYTGGLVTGNPAWNDIANIPNLAADVTDLEMAAQDWLKAKRHIQIIRGTPFARTEEKEALLTTFVDTLRHALLRVVKATCSVVGGIFSYLTFAFGGPQLPVRIALAISLGSTLAAWNAHFFKETCPYKLVDFSERQPALLVARAGA